MYSEAFIEELKSHVAGLLQTDRGMQLWLERTGLPWVYDDVEDVWIIDTRDGWLCVMQRGGDWKKVRPPRCAS
jgi:hypothetical protein